MISLSSAFIRSIIYHCPKMVSMTIARVSPSANIASDCPFPDIPPSITTSLQYLDLGDCHDMSIVNLYNVLKDSPNSKLLAVVKEGDMDGNKAILASCCQDYDTCTINSNIRQDPFNPSQDMMKIRVITRRRRRSRDPTMVFLYEGSRFMLRMQKVLCIKEESSTCDWYMRIFHTL